MGVSLGPSALLWCKEAHRSLGGERWQYSTRLRLFKRPKDKGIEKKLAESAEKKENGKSPKGSGK